jgi:hypothetical protein
MKQTESKHQSRCMIFYDRIEIEYFFIAMLSEIDEWRKTKMSRVYSYA